MKTVFLLRHAKSSWDDPSLDDHDRPLASRGLKDAPRMGKAFRKREIPPDRLLCSTALRARQTADLFREEARIWDLPVVERRLYGASVSDVLEIVQELPDETKRVMLVGHNPTFEDVIQVLTRSIHPMPTAALACVDFEVERWKQALPGTGRLRWLLTPKKVDT